MWIRWGENRRRNVGMTKPLLLAALATTLLASRPVDAAETGLPGSLPQLQVHGFISQGFLYTSANNYLSNTSDGSFRFSEAGLNFTLPAADRLTIGLQLFARNLGPIGDYRSVFDWYYLDYHWRDWLGFRAGRVKLPFGLYNDSSDVDSARTAILLPQSIYPAQNRDFLLAQTGGELYGYHRLGPAGALDYRAYAGTIFIDVKPQPGSPITIVDLRVPIVAGGRLLWESPVPGLRLGGSLQFLKLETDLLLPGTSAPFGVNVPARLWVASAEYVFRDYLFALEYSRWFVRADSTRPALFPESSTNSERGYALVSYRARSWLQAGAYYSVFFPDGSRRETRQDMELDAALTLRFDINPYWLVKVEGHYLHGTAALSPTLNGNQPLSALTPNWALFAVKTTAFF